MIAIETVTANDVFQAFSHDARLEIFILLSKQELCVGDIVDAVDRPQPSVSQYIKALYTAGLLEKRKEASRIYYYVPEDTYTNIDRIMRETLK